MKYGEPEIQPVPRPQTEDAYMAWAMQGYIHDFGLSAEDALDLARRDWEIHQWAQSYQPPRVERRADADIIKKMARAGERGRSNGGQATARAWRYRNEEAKARLDKKKAESRARARAAAAERKKVRDFRGVEFPCFDEMCHRWGINQWTVRRRLRDGWDLEKALRTKAVGNAKEATDHLGNCYPSISAMCRAHGITFGIWQHRRVELGWSLKRTLETPMNAYERKKKASVDHLGTKFRSVNEMVAAWGVPRSTYESRIAAGWSVKRALTGKGESK